MLRNQDRSPSFSLSLLTGWLCRIYGRAFFAAQCLCSLVRVGRSCFAIRSIVMVTALANAPGRLCDICSIFRRVFTYTSRLFTRAQSESQFFAPSGVDNERKVRSSLSRLAGPGRRPGRSIAMERNPHSPKSAQQGVAKYPQVFCVGDA